jgi:hypothetical protein
MIHEITRRRPSFNPAKSVPVVFADGCTWWLPKPRVTVRPVFKNGRTVNVDGRCLRFPHIGYGDDDIDALLALIAETDDPGSIVELVATLAAELLRRNYDLSDAELDELLCIRPADPASLGWLKAVVEVATLANRKDGES